MKTKRKLDTMKRAAVLGALATVLGILSGCSEVKPYQRAKLADFSMASDDPFTSALDEHVRAVSEGGSGGLAGGGGGCGCN